MPASSASSVPVFPSLHARDFSNCPRLVVRYDTTKLVKYDYRAGADTISQFIQYQLCTLEKIRIDVKESYLGFLKVVQEGWKRFCEPPFDKVDIGFNGRQFPMS